MQSYLPGRMSSRFFHYLCVFLLCFMWGAAPAWAAGRKSAASTIRKTSIRKKRRLKRRTRRRTRRKRRKTRKRRRKRIRRRTSRKRLRARSRRTKDPMLRQIRRVRRGHYRVPQGVVNHYQRDLAGLSRQVMVVPHKRKGQFIGFRFGWISKKSPLTYLGFRNEDILLKINGYSLNSMTRVMMAYVGLRSQKKFVVHILRRGRRIKHYIDIR